ncbi:MAG: GDP-L-fucose synthase [Spirochaetaceae bacterium]|jgi:GDP-L-fucose synthase|nr:GDP-L-fucose synthase [Spirochaetaceae bacterium]
MSLAGKQNEKIYVAGHRGLVGSAIVKKLNALGFCNIVTRNHAELDLTNQSDVVDFFSSERPGYVFLAAAKVGGIAANSNYPADFIYQNMMIGFNVVHAAYKTGVKKLLNLGSSCIYPRMANQPLKEEYLMTGALEPTNDAYAVAKIAVIKLCAAYNKQHGTNYISVMPANLYGPEDTYDTENGHVLPSMICKFHAAKISGTDSVTLWGDGTPYREFLYSEDLADALLFLMQNKNARDTGEFVNIGTGADLTISELAEIVRRVVYADSPGRICQIEWDASKPNGTPRKLLDISRLAAWGWRAKTRLEEGIARTYACFCGKRGSDLT